MANLDCFGVLVNLLRYKVFTGTPRKNGNSEVVGHIISTCDFTVLDFLGI